MPRPAKGSPEAKAWAAKMQAARNKTTPPVANEPTETPAENKVELTQDQFQALMERLDKLETNRTETLATKNEPQLNQLGRAVGVMQKYSVDPRDYQDPREELMNLPELERFAFKPNYYLGWDVEQTQYETKYGTSFSEPRFEIRLYKRLFEDDGTPTVKTDNEGKPVLDEQGRPQYKSYLVKKGFFFEDPGASVKEAQALGLPINNANSKDFLEQMRKLRYKTWLLEVFNKPKSADTTRKEQMTIGSSIVQVESYSEEV
jgi:tetrahydromethanopterin S-methyltransferase subunit G